MTAIAEEDRDALRAGLARFLQAEASEEKLRRAMENERGYDDAIWQQLAALGLLGIGIGAESGGAGGGAVDVAVISEELGRSLVPLPFIETGVIAATLLEAANASEETETCLARIVAGDARMAIGGDADVVPYRDPHHTLTLGSDGTVSGEVSLVMHGVTADYILLALDRDSATTVVLIAQDAGYVAEPQQANDPALRPARLRFDGTRCVALPELGAEECELARLRGVAALAAQQVGAARAVFETTVGYLGTRYQFGRPIGSFQALKHIAADLLVEVESATSAARAAARALDAGSPDAARSVALAGFICNDAFREVSAQAIQLHGGIAYTREHVAHLYWRRARAMLTMLGSSAVHREAYLQGWEKSA